MMLLIDIGNTRLKWAISDGKQLSGHGAEVHAGWDIERFTRTVLQSVARPLRVLVSNVNGPWIADIVREASLQRWNVEPEFVVSSDQACGVRNAYPVPQNLGVDRWLGVIAAHARQQRLTCIASVGTAMTIDAVTAAGQHLGGVIVPGPDLMVASLLRNTSDIAARAGQGNATADLFADNTLGAIRQGSVHALAGLVDRAMDSLQRRTGEEPALMLTGGAASAIAGLVHAPYDSVPDLVLQGLARYAATP